MFRLYKYIIPPQYAADFKKSYSYFNIKQVKMLSGILLGFSAGLRLISLFYRSDLTAMPNYMEYSLNNLVCIIGSLIFLVLSKKALSSGKWKIQSRNVLTLFFCFFILTVTFGVSYIFSLHNPKNTLTIFLIGIVMVSLFFALNFKQIIIISAYVLLLFIATMVLPGVSVHDRLFNFIAAIILALALYACSRYSYFYKAEHFIQLRQLKEKNNEVQLLNHQKGEILGFVAHDLRNPLNNIEALTRILLEEQANQDNTELQLILTSTRQAKHIINDLIEVVQNDKAPFKLQNTDLIAFVNRICKNWQKNTNKERTINFKAVESTLTTAVNPSKLTRAIDNLIGNGLKFSRPEMPINIEVSRLANKCIIQITDFGIGIPVNLQELLFDQFSKAGRTGLQGEKSIGLGLHISKLIIEQHGGSLTVNSKENEGATFQITLPIITV